MVSCKEVLSVLAFVFGYDDPTYSPSYVGEGLNL